MDVWEHQWHLDAVKAADVCPPCSFPSTSTDVAVRRHRLIAHQSGVHNPQLCDQLDSRNVKCSMLSHDHNVQQQLVEPNISHTPSRWASLLLFSGLKSRKTTFGGKKDLTFESPLQSFTFQQSSKCTSTVWLAAWRPNNSLFNKRNVIKYIYRFKAASSFLSSKVDGLLLQRLIFTTLKLACSPFTLVLTSISLNRGWLQCLNYVMLDRGRPELLSRQLPKYTVEWLSLITLITAANALHRNITIAAAISWMEKGFVVLIWLIM